METKEPTTGSNLKDIRKYLNLKQSDIAGEEITRNLISLIENDKTPINHKTATIITTNINNIMSQKHSTARIFMEDLLVPGLFNAKKEADTFILDLEANGNSLHFNLDLYLSKMNSFYAKWDLPQQKFELYYLLGEYFESLHQLDKSYLYFTRAYENAIRLPNKEALGEVAFRLTSIALVLKNYHSVINLSDVLKNYDYQISKVHMIKTSINESSAYYYLENYERAIDALLKAEHYVDDSTEILNIDIQLLKADLYIQKGMLGIAGRILKTMSGRIDQFSDHTKLYVQAGMLQLNLKLNQLEDAKLLFLDIDDNIKTLKQDHRFIPEIFSKLADASMVLTDINGYLHYIDLTLTSYIASEDKAKFSFHIRRVIDIYTSASESEFVFLKTLIQTYLHSGIFKDDYQTQLKLVELCLHHNAYDLSKDIIIKSSL